MVRGAQLARLLGRWQEIGPPGRRAPEYLLLANGVRSLLHDGRLGLGVRLPAERDLAEALQVSRTTVTAAYRVLRESTHLTSRRGAGSWTALPDSHRISNTGLWSPREQADLIDLGCAALAGPAQLTEAAREAVEELPRHAGGPGYHPAGLPALREAVAAEYAARGVPTRVDQIMITSGVQHAFDLIHRLLVAPGQRVLTELPTYPNALASLTARNARIVTHGVGPDGWDEELLLGSLRAGRPRLAYLIPEFHNPTGHLMPQRLRERLPAAAHTAGTDLVVDEAFIDLPLSGDPMPPPVAAFDRHARVLSIGGMSKPYWGGLRIGWIRAAAPLVGRLAALRVGMDMASPVLEQLVAVRLLARRDEIVPARRRQLRTQRDALVEALRRDLPEWRYRVPDGGTSIWVELDGPVSTALARAAEAHGVRLAPGPRFGFDGTMERFLRMPYSLPAADLVEAVHRIAAARSDLDRPFEPVWAAPAVVA